MMSTSIRKIFIGIIGLFVVLGFSMTQQENKALTQIKEIHDGVMLVRLPSEDAVLAKLKSLHYDKSYRKKVKEVNARNKAIYVAFSSGYSFSEMHFFMSRDSDKIRKGELKDVFVNSELTLDTTIHIDSEKPVYIVDVGDIFFEHINGHMEGLVVMDNQFNQLEKPFPFYVKKRSGFAILKRTELDMVLVLNKNLNNFYKKAIESATNK